MMATNDHALSWDGKQIAVTGITLPPPPAKIRTPADLHNPILIMNMDGSTAHEVHLGWLHGWSPDGKYVVYTQYLEDNVPDQRGRQRRVADDHKQRTGRRSRILRR
jgi:Tol biopolymer transport system component